MAKARENKKVNMKMSLIIKEIFSRINCDLIGPLLVSEKNNRCILKAVSMASKYTAAILLADIKSESVIDAFLIVFSKIEFQREIERDLVLQVISCPHCLKNLGLKQ